MSFPWQLFDEPDEYEETPLRDRKRDFPSLSGKQPAVRVMTAEFIRDTIALANTARLIGKPAYLLFGIDNKGQICGINEDMVSHYKNGNENFVQLKEKIRQIVKDRIINYIHPLLANHDLRFGERDGLIVAYLQIAPTTTANPFTVAKTIETEESTLAVSSCWIRIGESKHAVKTQEIAPTEDPYKYAYSDVPYLLPSSWARYFDSLLGEPDLADSMQISGYQEPNTGTMRQPLENLVAEFLNGTQRLLLIRGEAGIGKSSFLKRLVSRLADTASHEVEAIRERQEFLPPNGWIPICLPLRYRDLAIANYQSLLDALLLRANAKNAFWNDSAPQHGLKLFESSALHWVFCLDGLDEIWNHSLRGTFLRSLREILDRFPRVKIILTSRPYAAGVDWSLFPGHVTCDIQTLSFGQIESYISNFVHGSEAEQVLRFIQSHEDILTLCSYPSYLVAATQELFGYTLQQPQDWPLPGRIEEKNSSLATNLSVTQEPEFTDELPKLVSLNEFIVDEPVTDTLLIGTNTGEPNRADVDLSSAEDPTIRIGTVLHRIYYDYLWKREIERLGIPPIDADVWWDGAGMLALKTDGRSTVFRSQTIRIHLSTTDSLEVLLNIGVIHQPGSGLFSYFTTLTKQFFAASVIGSYKNADQISEVVHLVQDCTADFRQGMFDIFKDLYSDDLAPFIVNGGNYANT